MNGDIIISFLCIVTVSLAVVGGINGCSKKVSHRYEIVHEAGTDKADSYSEIEGCVVWPKGKACTKYVIREVK